MRRISIKHAIVIMLVVIAFYTVGSNLLPLLHKDDTPELYGDLIEQPLSDTVNESGHGLQAVQTGSLFWNASPQRDPFTNEVKRNMMKQHSNHRRMPSLSGFVAGGRSRLAVFDGRVVAVGQSVSGYRISSITSNGVILERDGRKTLLKPELGQ